MQDRMKNAEDFTSGLKKDLEVFMPKKTVGISPGNTSSTTSPFVGLSDRMEELSQQVSDLKKRVKHKEKKHGKEGRSESIHEDMTLTKEEASLNFSLTED